MKIITFYYPKTNLNLEVKLVVVVYRTNAKLYTSVNTETEM